MPFLKGIEWTPKNILKAIAIGLVALIFASFVFAFVKTAFESRGMMVGGYGGSMGVAAPAPGYYQKSFEESVAYDSDYGYATDRVGLSTRNVASPSSLPPINPGQGYATGNDAEAYEVTEYSASYETQDKGNICGQVTGLKSRSYVVFENSNEYDHGCDYRFKVEHARVQEVLSFLKGLKPKDLNENTYTIKSLVEDYTSQTEILEKKKLSIEQTLEEAIAAYDDIAQLATSQQDAESLARIIDSKIQLIERLTQQKININSELDHLARAKAEQLDRLAYTYFSVHVYENRYFDGERLADSWQQALSATVNQINTILQEATLGFFALLFLVAQWILYILVAVFIGKHVWRWGMYIWKGTAAAAPAAAPKAPTRRVKVSVPPPESDQQS